MCELFAMSFNQPISPKISFRGFRHRGRMNPDGWGIAWYPDKSVQTVKEPLEAKKSQLSKFLLEYKRVKSKIFIAHVRHANNSEVTYMNTNPFVRELNGKEYTFAHNGKLRNYSKSLSLGRFRPIGKTDSEYVFCHILNIIDGRSIKNRDKSNFEWLWNKLEEINNYGKFNCIFSDSEYLFCYHDINGYKRLCLVHRKAPYDKIKLKDEDFEINLSEVKNKTQTGYIIATNPLTNEEWNEFNSGELIVFENGRMVFSSSERINIID